MRFGNWAARFLALLNLSVPAVRAVKVKIMPSGSLAPVYFGGSRHFPAGFPGLPASLISTLCGLCESVHVGCQFGADAWVAKFANPSSLVVFAVAPVLSELPAHVQAAVARGARVVCGAGGNSAPMPARFLLRSIAAFQGCSSAVFFQPGTGSLAVARECVRAGLPVFAFGSYPAQIPACVGFWVESSFQGFTCWQWQITITQPALF
jgi:hypothetical protein